MANASKAAPSAVLKEMELGDSVELGTLLPGITPEKLKWELIETQPSEGKRTYVVSFFGIIVKDITLKEVASC